MEIWKGKSGDSTGDVLHLVRHADLTDLPYIEDLRQREWEAVGFIPMERYTQELDGRRAGGNLLVVEENGIPAGFAFISRGFPLTSIIQLAIDSQVRRQEKGSALLSEIHRISMARGRYGLRCRAASDLEACRFWEAMGFRLVGQGMGKFLGRPAGRHSRVIAKYERLAVPSLLDVGLLSDVVLDVPCCNPGRTG